MCVRVRGGGLSVCVMNDLCALCVWSVCAREGRV